MRAAETAEQKQNRMTTQPVERLILRLAIPTILTNLISTLYNMADTFFVGGLGTSATASVGVVFSLMAVIQALGFFFGHGSGNSISRQLGAKNYENASKTASTGFFSALFAGVLVAVLGLIFMRPLARLLGATPTIMPHALEYMRFILLGAPWMCSSLMLNNLLRYQGSAIYSMIGMVSGAVLNIGLDALFIFVFGMGVGGAALATMISQFVSFCLLLVGCTRGGNVRISFSNFAPSFQLYKEITRGGIPSMLRQSIASFASIMVNQVAGPFGDAAIAALAVVQRVGMMINSSIIGFGQGFQPVCGFNYGAKKYDRVLQAFWFCLRVTTVILLVLAGAAFVLAPHIILLFRDDPQVVEMGSLALRAQCFTFPLFGWITLNNMMMQTLGLAGRASLLAMSRQGLLLLPMLATLVPLFGLPGLLVCQPAADLATFLLALPLGISVIRGLRRSMAAPSP